MLLVSSQDGIGTWLSDDSSGRAVLVRSHCSDLPSPDERDRILERADVARMVSHPAIAAFVELIDLPTRTALVVAHPTGNPLADVRPTSLNSVDVLQVAIGLLPALAELHVHGVGHGGIGLPSLWYNSGEVMLASPWTDHLWPSPLDDQASLAGLVKTLLLRAGLRLPEGVRTVLEAAEHSNPELRYRSVVGLGHDLERCRDELRRLDMSSPFELSTQGYALGWRDPVRAIGLERVVAELGAQVTATRESGKPAVLVVEGPTGIGRSRLLAEFGRSLAAQQVAHGAAQFARGGGVEPLRAPREVIAHFVDQSMVGRAASRERFTQLLSERLGDDVAVAVRLAPSLTRLLGARSGVREGGALEKVARVEAAARTLVETLGAGSPPFVALFDDAENADEASLAIFRGLLTVQAPILMVLARRTDADQVGLSELLEVLRDGGTPVVTHVVAPVDQSSMHEMVSEGLGFTDGAAGPFAQALWSRSGGNPGVAIADLHTLLADGELVVDPRSARWTWSNAALKTAPSHGVADVTRQRIERITPSHRHVMWAAALAGQVATPTVLATAVDISLDATMSILDRLSADQLLDWRATGVVAFHDDGLRRAAEQSLDGPDRGALCLRLARAAMAEAQGRSDVSDATRFEVLQLLAGHEHALPAAEARVFVAWCEIAARVAHRSGGYAVALDLQLRQLEMAGPSAWEDEPDAMFELHLRIAENALVLDRVALVDQMLDQAWARKPSAMQRVRALRLLGNRWWTRQDQSGGLAEIHGILRELGEHLPTRPTIAHVALEYLATRRALRGRNPESFVTAPSLQDERVRATLDTMLSGVHLAYTTEPLTHVLLVLRGIRISASHGVSSASSYFVAGYGLLLCGLGRDLERGLGFGRAGIELSNRTGRHVHTMVVFAHNGFVRHWGEPLPATIEPLIGEYRQGLVTGRGGYAHTCGTFAVLHSLLSSRSLPRVDEMAEEMTAELERIGEGAFAQRVKLVSQAVADLRDGLHADEVLNGPHFAAEQWAAAKDRRGEFAVVVHTVRAMVALAYDRREDAARSVRAASGHVRTAPGQAIVGVHWFQVALLHELGADVSWRQARRAERQLRRAARVNPHEYAHRVALLDALAAGASPAQFDAAATIARQNDALADLCTIAHVAARRSKDPTDQNRWQAMAVTALRAWGAEGVVTAYDSRRVTADE